MWWPSKKEIKKEFKKVFDSFKKRDDEISELKAGLVSKKEIDLMIREAILKVQSGQNSGLYSEPKAELKKGKHYERTLLKKVIKTRPQVIKTAIRGLIEKDMNTTNIFNVVVEEKKLCGKTQFYHYLSLVRNELRTGLRTELRTKQRKI